MSTLDRLCAGCGIPIDDPYFLMIAEQTWHSSCLKCADCQRSLEHESTCFAQHGHLFCKNDYLKRSSPPICPRCSRPIQPDEIILRAQQLTFHIDCFTCQTCARLLRSGDEFGLRENAIHCREHILPPISSPRHDDSGYHTSPNESSEHDEHCSSVSPRCLSSSYYLDFTDASQPTKLKRLRTSFKHHQLRYMRSYFHLNHNPDAKDLKNLSEKTNLPKRVLQVWFQNARAKFRRSSVVSHNDQALQLHVSNTCLSSA